MTPSALIRETSAKFRTAGIPDPETDSSLLLSSLTGKNPLFLRLDTDTELPSSTVSSFYSLAARRLTREPLQYILGKVTFHGHLFQVDSRVLIPRPETELLCDWILETLPRDTCSHVLDLCCGSGCIGLTVAAERPSARVTLSDLSPDALSSAIKNADLLHVHASFHLADLGAGLLPDSFDCVVCNPPYIPCCLLPSLQPEVLREPAMALDGGEDGLLFYRRIANEIPLILRNNSLLFLELGYGESEPVASLLSDAGFSDISVRNDLNGIPRMLKAAYTHKEESCSRNSIA